VRQAGGITVSNGLAFSPDGRTLYWSDTTAHTVHAFDFDPLEGALSRQRVFAQFPRRTLGQPLADYGGRPDGAAVDAGGLLLGGDVRRRAPAAPVARRRGARASWRLPVRCPTMPCFGGADLRTLFITTARAEPAGRGARARALGRPRAAAAACRRARPARELCAPAVTVAEAPETPGPSAAPEAPESPGPPGPPKRTRPAPVLPAQPARRPWRACASRGASTSS
jgi:hypothetical protein